MARYHVPLIAEKAKFEAQAWLGRAATRLEITRAPLVFLRHRLRMASLFLELVLVRVR